MISGSSLIVAEICVTSVRTCCAVDPVMGVPAWLVTADVPIAELSVLKKLSPASTAEAATREVLASVEIDEFSAVLKFAAVAAGVEPMVKLPVGGGDVLVAVNWTESVVPSGSLKVKLIVSPGLGLPVKFTEIEGGEPVGPVAVALVSDDDTELSLRPNGEPAESSATCTDVVVGVVTSRWPIPLGP